MKILEIVEKIAVEEPRIVSIVGAGISKASGMPTFRGEDGMWNNYSAMELATPQAFAKDPQLVWNWYKARMRILLKAKPNDAHFALTKLEKAGLSLGIITQNVDGLHELAGSKKIIEIHGRIRYARCTSCKHVQRWDKDEIVNERDSLLYCPNCEKSLLRPDVVWFGEPLDPSKSEIALDWLSHCNLVLVIGTSGVVYPVASFPSFAKENGAKIIEFNIESTPLTPICDFSVFGKCEENLPLFVEELIRKIEKSKSG
ncbi:MAG: NAD-dependent deacylase [Candidatus Heimdallarchaeum endolithica]|uniref:NAD-dependent protein deacylase n=1 Tax=Candidatus Heimdallarchaeum endolithica TaxID=2876572 RepID=A0A9Y1FNS4_9ARCH|nr:MAG: NAD-dependent deacylase [Candidatus Heimdallarchaeum endolithica]